MGKGEAGVVRRAPKKEGEWRSVTHLLRILFPCLRVRAHHYARGGLRARGEKRNGRLARLRGNTPPTRGTRTQRQQERAPVTQARRHTICRRRASACVSLSSLADLRAQHGTRRRWQRESLGPLANTHEKIARRDARSPH